MDDDELTQRLGQLINAQLRFQAQLGDVVRIFRERIEAQDRVIEEIRSEIQEIRSKVQEIRSESLQTRARQSESDQRFEALLDEVRFLIRQRQSPEDHP